VPGRTPRDRLTMLTGMTATADRTGIDEPPAPARPGGSLRRLLTLGFTRFILVGGVSAAIDMGLLWLLHGVLGVWLPVATFTGVAFSFVVNFLLNRRWVFGAAGPAAGQFARYLTLAALNWMLTVLTVTWLTEVVGLYFMLARVLALAVFTVLNFLALRAWVFRAR
jgi:putative flippase GtrA